MSYDQTSKQIFIYTLRLGNSADLEYMISLIISDQTYKQTNRDYLYFIYIHYALEIALI